MNIKIFGQKELLLYMKHNTISNSSCLISISNPKQPFRKNLDDSKTPEEFKARFLNICKLNFYDIERKNQLKRVTFRRVPKKRDVQKIIKFYNSVKNQTDEIFIHCWEGRSRSTAVALGLLYIIHQDEKTAMQKLLEIRTIATPNIKIVEYFDILLGSNLLKEARIILKDRMNTIKEEFMKEINNGDDLLEEL